MTKVGIFYGTSTGNTEHVAELIAKEPGEIVESVTNIVDARPDDLSSAESLILGVSTWEDGQLQEDWDKFFPKLDKIDLAGRTVGSGSQTAAVSSSLDATASPSTTADSRKPQPPRQNSLVYARALRVRPGRMPAVTQGIRAGIGMPFGPETGVLKFRLPSHVACLCPDGVPQ